VNCFTASEALLQKTAFLQRLFAPQICRLCNPCHLILQRPFFFMAVKGFQRLYVCMILLHAYTAGLSTLQQQQLWMSGNALEVVPSTLTLAV